MNVNKLRRSLRTAGFEKHARNLGAYLAEHGGAGCQRTVSKRTLLFQLDGDGRLLAYLQTPDGWTPVADEDRVHLTREDAAKRWPVKTGPEAGRGADMVHLGIRIPRVVGDRLERAARASGKRKSDIVRAAVRAYLDNRGL